MRFFKKKEPVTVLGKGIDILNKKGSKLETIVLPDSARKGHLFVQGSTRVGKTKVMENMITQDIRKGYSVMVVDPKGDIELFSKIVQVACEENREEDLFLITPIYPEYSAKVDPLSHYYMPEELVSHITSGIKAKEEFFVNVANETTHVIIQSLILFQKMGLPNATHINVEAIKRRCSFNGLQELRSFLQGVPGEEAEEVRHTLGQLLSSPQDYFSKISSSLRTVLTALSTGSMGAIIGKAEANEFIHRLEEGRSVIVVVQTGSLLTRRTASIAARVLVSMVQSFIGRRFSSGKTIEPPLCMYLDEFSNIAYIEIADLFSKAGGAGCWITAFTQSVADLNAEIGPEYARKILDNTNSKMFMRINDPETAQYVADYSGTKSKTSRFLQLGGGITLRDELEPLVLPEDVTKLNPRDFYFFSFDGAYKGRSLFVPPSTIKVKYPEITTERTVKDDRQTVL